MSVYTILEVGDPREWSNNYGRYHSFPLKLKDETGETHFPVERNAKFKDDTPPRAPEVGEELVGEIEHGTRGDKIKIDYEATKANYSGSPSTGTSGGSKNYGGSGREWTPEAERDPEKVARIGRSHAQSMAVQTLTAMGAFEGKSADHLHSTLKSWTDFFEADVNEAASKAAQKAGGGSTGDGSTGPTSPSSTPGQAQDETQSNAEYLDKLLQNAGFDVAQATVVQRYIETQFDNERRSRAELALRPDNTPRARELAVETLTKEAEAWTGEPLPVHDPASSEIPF